MKYKAVIFDLDGTLLNTLEDLADSMNRVLDEKGLPIHPTEAYRTFVGSGAAELVSRSLPAEERNEELTAECLNEFRKVYSSNWKNKTRPYEGVPELLDSLTLKGIKMAVLTNKPQNFADLCIEEFLSEWEFAEIHGQREGLPMKPDPAGPRGIALRLNISPDECLFIGDSDIDMITAVNAGMFPVGALWGFRSEMELVKSGAAKVLHKPIEFLDLLS
jgi:phosphoglycolate phosphatase